MRHRTRLFVASPLLAVVLPALTGIALATLVPAIAASPALAAPTGGPPRIIAWNDLGMHCIDPDYSIFSILPPFNNVNAHVVVGGKIRTEADGYSVTFEGVADPSGSINTTSIGKTNFWQYAQPLFGVSLPLDVGLTGTRMPGPENIPQPLSYVSAWSWFQAEGIPLTPLDNALLSNPYPLFRLVARNGAGAVVASTITTAPNSQELTCSACHASGQSPFARPATGWVYDPDPIRDDHLNILRLHDDTQGSNPDYVAALVAAGYDPAGLHTTVVSGGIPIFCDRCHASNALPGTGMASVSPLTRAMHGLHGRVLTADGLTLDENPNRSACYTCHPGFVTQCLRGAMGKAIGPGGGFLMQCQSCHGNMSAVGAIDRSGWLEEPACQSCHTGSATLNSGQIRFASVFDASGQVRQPALDIFATEPDTPAPGLSLYRFSEGHGGLQCSTCHGPPHAIYPTSEDNDNLQSLQLQGHVGTISDCTVCHAQLEDDELVGPHGMHPATQDWATGKHADAADHGGIQSCRACHGDDGRGTILSRAQGDRSFTTRFGPRNFWRGFQVSCYACHDGPDGQGANSNRAPVVPDLVIATPSDVPMPRTLAGTDADGDPLTFRIVSQPRHGTVDLTAATATYFPDGTYRGDDSFTYAAYDGDTDSNLGTVQVTVNEPACAGRIETYGFGCPGSGDLLPHLSVNGCPTPGGDLVLGIDNALGGANVHIVVGRNRDNREISRGGCILRVTPVISIKGPYVLSGSGPGDGRLVLPGHLSANRPGGRLTIQAFVSDPTAPGGWSSTNAVELTIR